MQKISIKKIVPESKHRRNIVSVRVKNGEFYFLSWLKNTRTTTLVAKNPIKLGKNSLKHSRLCRAIINTEEWGISDAILVYKGINCIDHFLKPVIPYHKDKKEYNVFIILNKEIHQICDTIEDGDYIFLIDD